MRLPEIREQRARREREERRRREEQRERDKHAAFITINPNPRLVALMNYALDEVVAKLRYREEHREWLEWAAAWKAGQRSPQACVSISHKMTSHKDEFGQACPVRHTLGQLAWGAKEACYSHPQAGWLVVRDIADAMHVFGVAYSDKAAAVLLEPPTIEGDPLDELARIDQRLGRRYRSRQGRAHRTRQVRPDAR